MNKDRIVGVAIFGGAAVAFLVLAAVKAVQPGGFRVWDALAGMALGLAVGALVFGWSHILRVLGIEYLLTRLRSR